MPFRQPSPRGEGCRLSTELTWRQLSWPGIFSANDPTINYVRHVRNGHDEHISHDLPQLRLYTPPLWSLFASDGQCLVVGSIKRQVALGFPPRPFSCRHWPHSAVGRPTDMPTPESQTDASTGMPVNAPLTGELTAANGRSDTNCAFTIARGVLNQCLKKSL